MLPKSYHAILFICILVMLLLLGLHLLGIGYSSGQTAAASAKTAALARNSSLSSSSQQTTSSSNVNQALSQSQAYRHPIIYDKLTGATNNQINEVLGAGKQATTNDYPLDHYQQQQQPQSSHQFSNQQLPSQDDFFNNIHRQGGSPGGGGFPLPPPPINHHLHLSGMGPPGMQIPPPMMTTQTPTLRPQPLPPPPPPIPNRQLQMGSILPPMAPPPPPMNQRPSVNGGSGDSTGSAAQATDSLPSASSLDNNGQQSPRQQQLSNNGTTNQQKLQLQPAQPMYPQQQQQTYYTPPIFAYNNFDQNRPLVDPQLSQLPYGFPSTALQQQPPLGVPEVPLSIDEYNARQARLRPQQQQQNQLINNNNNNNNEQVAQIDRYGKPSPQRLAMAEPQYSSTQQPTNLLGNQEQQQRHKQQMLDRNQLLFGPSPTTTNYAPNNVNQTYYPDPATINYHPLVNSSPPSPNSIRPPYAHNMSPTTVELAPNSMPEQFGNKRPNLQQAAAQNRAANTNNRLDTNQQAKLGSSTERPPPKMHPTNSSPQQSMLNHVQTIPTCVRQQALTNETLVSNSTVILQQQTPVLFCNEDSEYPTKDIMRALENYASERSIEQLLPQPMVQLLLAQRNQSPDQRPLTLIDSLQASIGAPSSKELTNDSEQQQQQTFFPSSSYEPMCKSNIYLAQPRRAKNLLGQWKIVVNLPGHKYRGIAVSQMLRIEECSRPNSECTAPNTNQPNSASTRSSSSSLSTTSSIGLLARSRCLQQYENQRLVSWSHQQGLHVDIFRVPIACSCHIRR